MVFSWFLALQDDYYYYIDDAGNEEHHLDIKGDLETGDDQADNYNNSARAAKLPHEQQSQSFRDAERETLNVMGQGISWVPCEIMQGKRWAIKRRKFIFASLGSS